VLEPAHRLAHQFRRAAQIPLRIGDMHMAKVGEAIVAYLEDGRPRCTNRRLFVRDDAPIRGFLGPSAIGCIVTRAIRALASNRPPMGHTNSVMD
jgi:hypothetical protein